MNILSLDISFYLTFLFINNWYLLYKSTCVLILNKTLKCIYMIDEKCFMLIL